MAQDNQPTTNWLPIIGTVAMLVGVALSFGYLAFNPQLVHGPDRTPYAEADLRAAQEETATEMRAEAEADDVRRACIYGPQTGGAICPDWQTVTAVAGSVADGYVVTKGDDYHRVWTFPQGFASSASGDNDVLVQNYSSLYLVSYWEGRSVVRQAVPLMRQGTCLAGAWGWQTIQTADVTATPDGLFLGDSNQLRVSDMSLHPELDALENDIKTAFMGLFGVEHQRQRTEAGTSVFSWVTVATGTFDLLANGQTPVEWVDAQLADNAALIEHGVTDPAAQALVKELWAGAKRWQRQGLSLWEAVQFVVNLKKQENLKVLAANMNAVDTPFWLIVWRQDANDNAQAVLAPVGNTAPCAGTNFADSAFNIQLAQD